MFSLRPKKREEMLQPSDFQIEPNTICFGADKNLTVITAYIQPSPKLTALITQKKRLLTFEQIPQAYIATYDVEYTVISLICITPDLMQHNVPLTQRECNALYAALRAITAQKYHMEPEDILNQIRSKNNYTKLP